MVRVLHERVGADTSSISSAMEVYVSANKQHILHLYSALKKQQLLWIHMDNLDFTAGLLSAAWHNDQIYRIKAIGLHAEKYQLFMGNPSIYCLNPLLCIPLGFAGLCPGHWWAKDTHTPGESLKPMNHVFGLWKEAGVHTENPRMHTPDRSFRESGNSRYLLCMDCIFSELWLFISCVKWLNCWCVSLSYLAT